MLTLEIVLNLEPWMQFTDVTDAMIIDCSLLECVSDRSSLEECKIHCLNGDGNALNWNSSGLICCIQNCVDPKSPPLKEEPDDDGWKGFAYYTAPNSGTSLRTECYCFFNVFSKCFTMFITVMFTD